MKKFTPLPDERTDAGGGGGKWKIEQYSGRPETAKKPFQPVDVDSAILS